MKLLADDTVVKEAFATASRFLASLAVAEIVYFVARSSWTVGFQLVPSEDIAPAILVPDSVVMVTDTSVPSVTLTTPELLIDALSELSFGEMEMLAADCSLAAAAPAE